MKKLLRNLSMLALMIIGGAQMAWAQETYTTYYANDYEDGVVQWTNATSGRYTTVIKSDDTKYASVDESTRQNNGTTLTSTETSGKVEAGTNFTFTCRVKLGASNNQTATAFNIYDATNSTKILSLAEGSKKATAWIINGDSEKKVTVSTGGDKTLANLNWITLIVAYQDGMTALTVKDAAGEIIDGYDRTVITTTSPNGGLGKLEFVTSRYKANFAIDDILVRSVLDTDVPAAVGYTFNYIFDGLTIHQETGKNTVDAVVDASLPITVNDQKYYAVDGATTSLKVTNVEANNVLDIELRKAYEYSYTVNSNLGDEIQTGTSVEGETVYAAYPKYKNVDGTLYEAPTFSASSHYTCSFIPNADNYVHTITYSATDITNVVYYSEGEYITGATESTAAGTNMGVRSSNGTCGYATSDVTIANLTPGEYQVNTCVYSNKAAGVTLNFAYGTEAFAIAHTGASNGTLYSNKITIKESTDLIWQASGDNQHGIDYIYIVRTGDPSISISLPADYIYSTFCSEYDLDFTDNTAVEAYIAYGDGENVYLEQVNRVPGGTGLVLKKLGDATTATVPVAQILELTKEEEETLSLNTLWPVLDGPISAEDLAAEGNAYILEDDYKFSKVVEGATGKLAVGKAYLMYNAIGGGPLWIKIFDGEATAIKGVEVKAAQADNAIYNLQGVRVSKPTAMGLYIINGKKHLCK